MSKIKIEITDKEEIEVKRFYIPHEIKLKCPKCDNDVSFLGDDYLSYPVLNSDEHAGAYCYECESELSLNIKLSFNIEYDPDKIKIID